MSRRAQPVLDLLEKLNARYLGGLGFPSQKISMYSVDGRMILLHEHSRENGKYGGYDVYVPVVDSNRVDATLEALEAYVKGER